MNLNHELTLNSTHFSPQYFIVFSSNHCSVQFSTETDLYEHLVDCCNKYVDCTKKTLNKLVEHIDGPVKRRKIYLMIHLPKT